MKRNKILQILKKCNAIEVSPCVYISEDEGRGYYERCEPSDPDLFCWSVYGHYAPETGETGLECIADCGTEKWANALAEILEQHLGRKA